MRATFDGMVPIWLDAGYRIDRQLVIGAYFQWGLAFVADAVCPPPLRCAAKSYRFGANVAWHFKWVAGGGAWAGPFDPWFAFGAGYESTEVRLDDGRARSRGTEQGFELANFQLGVDLAGEGPVRGGIFAAFTVAAYERRTLATAAGTRDFTLADPPLHNWLIFGVRGRYDL